jgi:hypothetical protein
VVCHESDPFHLLGCNRSVERVVLLCGGPTVLWRNIDLCSIDIITLRYDRATGKTSAEVK